MTLFNMHEAKTHLSSLVERARNGETIVIARAGQPLVELRPTDGTPIAAPRRLGIAAGCVQIAPDFDDLPDDMVAAFANPEL